MKHRDLTCTQGRFRLLLSLQPAERANSSPRIGCALGVPCLTLVRTCRAAVRKSICSQRRSTIRQPVGHAYKPQAPWSRPVAVAVVAGGLNQPFPLCPTSSLAGSRWKPIASYRMSTTKSKCAAKPPGASAIRITNSRRNKPSRRLAGCRENKAGW